MNIFLHELKSYGKSTILWSVALVLVATVFFLLYPSFSKDVEKIKGLMEGFPEAIRIGMGITLESFASILGYYSFPFTFVLLIGSIEAMNFGISVVSKEVSERTGDFLLTKPIRRRKILTYKIMAIVTLLVITNIIYIVATTIIISIVSNKDYSFQIFFMISITLLFVQLIFMSLGVAMSVMLPKIKSVLSISLATVFLFYFISFLSSKDPNDMISYITPFKYFDPAYIIKNSTYDRPFLIITLVFIIVSITGTYVIYSKRDIHTV
ncbi:MAG: ABC transporter permease [Anaeromicrobium sp.]|jgi:ABC-2 type transport system permease protein|uniref:ABC transporter permease subunit n=1 Tax=Anaeromicrobium sp. TaxID=1929132 RepID=UPI0025E7664B|nr:ABC transporter permease subunit [Anaeromicrobium sp.]MCT4593828.1 ABC transporter permease [Anaeromicrobium sp.]